VNFLAIRDDTRQQQRRRIEIRVENFDLEYDTLRLMVAVTRMLASLEFLDEESKGEPNAERND
jgi:hypothetical protein